MQLNYIITEKDDQPVFISLEEAKDHLKIDAGYEDDIISNMIPAAVMSAENYMGISLLQKDVVITMSGFPSSLPIDFGPVLRGEFVVSYYDVNGDEKILSVGAYTIQRSFGKKPKFILDNAIDLPEVSDRKDAVSFVYVAGMVKESLPTPIRSAMLLEISDLYEYRTDRAEIFSKRSHSLMRPYKVWD